MKIFCGNNVYIEEVEDGTAWVLEVGRAFLSVEPFDAVVEHYRALHRARCGGRSQGSTRQ